MAKKIGNTSTNLGQLQLDAENAARVLKGATTSFNTAKLTLERAEASHSVAQKTLQAGMDQVKAHTKVV